MASVNTLVIPPDGWDSHMHVMDLSVFPLSPTAQYTPSSHTLDEAMAFEAKIGLRNIVLVQPSFYGTDNGCLLEALQRLGPNCARAVVVVDPRVVSQDTLSEWHELGVRGVRLNLKTTSQSWDRAKVRSETHSYVDLVRHRDWVLQLCAPLDMVEWVFDIIRDSGIKVCFDHFGNPNLAGRDASTYLRTRKPCDLEGFESLISLMNSGRVYVKFSSSYRLVDLDNLDVLEPIAREFLRVRDGEQVVFGTDWPQTRVEDLDVLPYLFVTLGWMKDDEALSKVLKTNASSLWDI